MAYIVTLSGTHQNEYMNGWLTDLTHKSPISNLWRPSKMEWMQPVGAAIAGIGATLTATGVGVIAAAPLMLIGGGLTAAGTVGQVIYAEDQKSKAEKAQQTQQAALAEQKKKNGLMIGGAVLAAVAGVYFATKG